MVWRSNLIDYLIDFAFEQIFNNNCVKLKWSQGLIYSIYTTMVLEVQAWYLLS